MAKNSKKKLTDYQKDRIRYYEALRAAYDALCTAECRFEVAESIGSCIESDYDKDTSSANLYEVKMQMQDDLDGMKRDLSREWGILRRLRVANKVNKKYGLYV